MKRLGRREWLLLLLFLLVLIVTGLFAVRAVRRATLQVKLLVDDLRRIEETIPASAIAGTRYDAIQMRLLDSERQ